MGDHTDAGLVCDEHTYLPSKIDLERIPLDEGAHWIDDDLALVYLRQADARPHYNGVGVVILYDFMKKYEGNPVAVRAELQKLDTLRGRPECLQLAMQALLRRRREAANA